MSYEWLKWLHILSGALLLGSSVGSAYYLLLASRSGDPRVVVSVTGLVIWADVLFTATNLMFLPLSGWALAWMVGHPLGSSWLVGSTVLLVVAAVCWWPLMRLQRLMRDLAQQAASENVPLPPAYWRYRARWALAGLPILLALLATFYLMVARPA